ncbi:unnamed protein product, partial [Closterium sp. NIES-53]
EDLVSHLRTCDACYRATVPAEFLDRNQPPMFITLYFIVTRLPDSLRSVRDHFLSIEPTSLTVDLLKQHLLAAETSAVAVGAARGTPRPPFFEECSPSPLAPSYASVAAADVSVAEDVGAASASAKRRSSKGKGDRGGGGGNGGGGVSNLYAIVCLGCSGVVLIGRHAAPSRPAAPSHPAAPSRPAAPSHPAAPTRRPTEPRRPAEPRRTAEPLCPYACTASAATTTPAATAATAAMASPTVLTFDAEGRAVDFDVWVDDLQLLLQCDSRDGVSLFDHTFGVSTAPAATADSTVRSQWTTRDAVARLAIRSHLPPAERAHFGQYKTAQSLYDAVVAHYSSPATAALSRLMLPYLFLDLAAFASVADLITHLRTSDARYRAALPT